MRDAWLVLRAMPWENLRIADQFGVRHAKPPEGALQPSFFAPIFMSRQAAQEWTEDGRYDVIEVSLPDEQPRLRVVSKAGDA